MNIATKKTLTFILMALLLFGAGVGLAFPEKAEADLNDQLKKAGEQCAKVAAANTLIELGLSAIGGTSVPVSYIWKTFKETFLDCIVWATTTVFIQDITDSMITWIQSGFNGNPAFVQNPEKFLGDVRERAVSMFVDELVNDLNNDLGGLLCTPFKRPIIQAIITIHSPSRYERDIQCTLDDAIANLDGFLDGDFSQGGWNGWIKLVDDNPYSQFITVERELDSRIASAVGAADKKLLFGDGFLSWESQICFAYYEDGSQAAEFDINKTSIEEMREQDPDIDSFECNPSEIKTPGSVINTQLNEQLGSPRRKFEVADEVNELITALMQYLVNEIFESDEGLAGYKMSESERSPDFILPDPTPPPGGGGCATCDGVDDVPPGPPGPDYTFRMSGSFRPVEPQTDGFYCEMNPPQNVHYDRIVASWDIQVDSWEQGANNTQAFRHDFFELMRGRWRDNFGYLPFEQGGAVGNGIVLRHGVDLEHGDKAKSRVSTSLPTGLYHIDYVFDTTAGVVRAEVTKPGGEKVIISQPMQGWDGSDTPALSPLTSVNIGNKPFYTGFSSFVEPLFNPAEAPSYGATFRNLVIEFRADDGTGAPVVEEEACGFISGIEGPPGEGGGGGGGNPNPNPDF
jgi:hypothetical protein